jgi:hypothetical protein
MKIPVPVEDIAALPPTETAPGCLHHPPRLPGPAKAGDYSELANCVVPRRGVLFDLSPESTGSKQAHHQGDRNRAVEVRVRCMSHLVAIGECGWSAGANGQVFAVSLALPEDVITSWARKQVSALTEAATSTWYAALPPKEEDEWTSRGRGQVLARHGTAALRVDSESLPQAPCRRPGFWLQSAVSEARRSWIQLSLRSFFGRQEGDRKERAWPFATYFFTNPKCRQNELKMPDKLTLGHPCVPLTKRPWVHGWRGAA